MDLPPWVKIVEVGPRDGLQNEKKIIDVPTKVRLIEGLVKAGLRHVEAGSFVSARWVPAMANSDEVYATLQKEDCVHYPILVPNEKGLDIAIARGVKEISCFTAASDAFNKKNINCTIDESLERIAAVVDQSLAHNIPVRAYVSCVVACPYQGAIKPSEVKRVVEKLFSLGCYEVSLGDTIGVATPADINTLLDTLLDAFSVEKLALHLHDTYGQALANIYTGLQRGIHIFDSSVAGLGGCPYAKGASGNVATEDLVYMLHGLGIKTGVDLDELIETGDFISRALERENQSKVAKAVLGGKQVS